MKTLSIRMGIEDTDCNGVVYHPNYLKFMERGRCELLRSHGVDLRLMLEEGIIFVVYTAELNYLKPAFLDDVITVSTEIIKVGGASLDFSQTIKHAENREHIYCQGKIKVVCVNRELKPRALPIEFQVSTQN